MRVKNTKRRLKIKFKKVIQKRWQKRLLKKKKKEQKFTPMTSVADFRNQLRNAIKKDKSHINKIKSIINTEQKQENKPKSDIDEVVNVWNTPDIPMILSLYDEETYNKIQNIIIRENNKNFHVFTPDLLAFTKKYNDKIVIKYSKDNNYKIGMDILYKGLYRLINNIISYNKIKMKKGSPTDVFKDRHDYNLGLKRISKNLSHKIYSIKD